VLVPDDAVRAGLERVRLAGRFQIGRLDREWILDVAHNPDAARVLAANLAARRIRGRTIAVCGILADKDIDAIVGALAGQVQEWIAVRLDGPRSLPVADLAARIALRTGAPVAATDSVASGCALAVAASGEGDRILVFGSFLTVGPALAHLGLEFERNGRQDS
jgi:dihydrofolate synthase/folylpolyglutamate synthase